MPVAVLMEFPEANAGDYDRVMQQMGEDFVPPEGAISHVAVDMEDGLRVLDVWDSREQFEGFYESRLKSAFEAAGVSPGNEPKYHEVHNVMTVERLPSPAA